MRAWHFCTVAFCVSLPFRGGSAQDTTSARDTTTPRPTPPADVVPARDAAGMGVPCSGQRVTDIVIVPQEPTMVEKTSGFVPRTVARTLLTYANTKPSVVRSYLLLEEGKRCTELARQETARVLRAQPFIADASVIAYPDTGGGVRVEVRTVDEVPLVIGGSLGSDGVTAVRLGNSNIAGMGMYGDVSWERGFAYRTGFGAHFEHYHVFQRPYRLNLVAERLPVSHELRAELTHPFFTTLQRNAWHTGVADVRYYQSFVRPDGDPLSLVVDRQLWDVGGIFRISGTSRGVFTGAALTHERIQPGDGGVIISDTGFVGDTTVALSGRYPSSHTTRLSALAGVRLLSYVRARGFDALTADQDIARGIRLAAQFGRDIATFGGTDRDYFLSGDLYAGVGTPSSFVGLSVRSEARRDRVVGKWVDIITSGRLAWYDRTSENGTLVASAELSSLRDSRFPAQLTFRDARGGLRGFGDSRIAGGTRTVLRIEQRWVRGHVTSHATWGLAAFTDVGKMWAGQVPFGANTGVRASVGVSLLGAIPPSSRQLIRADIAVPVTKGAGGKWELLFSVGNRSRYFWREPADVARARAGSLPMSVGGWP
ncbi:MAG TPA: hypothetical protein VF041_18645 [Gemmatimonadaceae bacterium]